MKYIYFFILILLSCTKDKIVEFEGVVVNKPGDFNSFTNDNGFAIASDQNGIYISSNRILDIKLGDKIKVKGTYKQIYTLPALDLIDYKIISHNNVLPIVKVKLNSLSDTSVGLYARVKGRVRLKQDNAPYGYQIIIEDEGFELQVFIPYSSSAYNLDFINKIQIDSNIIITGYIGRFENKLEILPINIQDIIIEN